MSPDDLIPTEVAAVIVGVPVPDFTELTDALMMEAAVPGSKTQSRQWRRADIEALRDGPHGAEARAAVSRDAEVAAEVAALAVRFPEWKAAIRAAADAMFQFNRYAKWAACTRLRKAELYKLKSKFLELLCDSGFCVGVVLHSAEADEDDDEGRGPREYLAFAFVVDGRKFSWHAPKKQVHWKYELTVAPATEATAAWAPNSGAKPVTLADAEFVQAEALIRFVLAGAEADERAAREVERLARSARMKAEGLARQAALRQQQEAEQ